MAFSRVFKHDTFIRNNGCRKQTLFGNPDMASFSLLYFEQQEFPRTHSHAEFSSLYTQLKACYSSRDCRNL